MFVFVFIFFTFILYYIYHNRKFSYLSKRNIKHEPPIPIFGNHLPVIFIRRTDYEMYTFLYNKYRNEKVVGYYKGERPEILIRDPDLVKNVLNVNFQDFCNRGAKRDPEVEPQMYNLFSEEGNTWKLLKTNLSPAFTSSKIKSMFPTIMDCADKLLKVADELAVERKEFDACSFCARFTIDLIGACGFGIDMNTLSNEHSLFLQLRDIVFIKSKWQMFLYGIFDLFPNSFIRKVQISRSQTWPILREITDTVSKQRQNGKIQRNDFINLLIELRKVGKIRGDVLIPDENCKDNQLELEFHDNRMIAQLFIFFVAGFETSSTTMSYAMHQLAFHPEIQQEVQEEVDKILAKYNNRLSYDAVSELSLLEMVVKEALRLFPPGAVSTRVCVKDYKVPGLDLTIEAGTKVLIPIHGLQMDPLYFDNPEEFNPKRFSPESSEPRHKYAYLPFGEGPRKCIGARLGTLQVMSGLAMVLSKFTIKPSESSTRNVQINRAAYIVQCVAGGLPLKLVARDNK